ncbi:phosphoglucomutase/phosphomannomutase family protein [Salisaeta longa]|uniref:phosphoglucomutase/phosphomannomutase family protein n=1 Tax=Salisaeta longa TaxID=503170 RepID=UPI0003B3EF42|nr:phosphoglucomutase/phosphomannomutase family protein [Salisaeta longa]
MASPISFGTDGWRAVIAEEYTFDNLARVAQATANWLLDDYGPEPSVVLGHDTRFMSRSFAQFVARIFGASGLTVHLADTFVPTPAVSWGTLDQDADAGLVITASHNPPHYNGFKIKADFGGPAPPAMIDAVEARIPAEGPAPDALPELETLQAEGRVSPYALRSAYLHVLRERLDIEAIAASGLTIAHDAMYGAGQGFLQELLGDQVVPVRHDENPGFHGQAPEPIARNLAPLAEAIATHGADVGIANDGDADRIGMYDATGRFVSSHRILALLVKYLVEERGLTGTVVKTFSTTHMLDAMAARYDLPLETTPIGFKYIATKMADGNVLVGGEESGGIAAAGHIPERDGLYIGLLLVEMMVKRGRPLAALVQELYDDFGPHHCYRDDLHITDALKERVLARLAADGGLDTIDGRPVQRVDTLDGYKHIAADGWLLIRPSGTEPVLRVYSEAETPDGARALVKDAIDQLGLAEVLEAHG